MEKQSQWTFLEALCWYAEELWVIKLLFLVFINSFMENHNTFLFLLFYKFIYTTLVLTQLKIGPDRKPSVHGMSCYGVLYPLFYQVSYSLYSLLFVIPCVVYHSLYAFILNALILNIYWCRSTSTTFSSFKRTKFSLYYWEG
jgi:hypothetical protein